MSADDIVASDEAGDAEVAEIVGASGAGVDTEAGYAATVVPIRDAGGGCAGFVLRKIAFGDCGDDPADGRSAIVIEDAAGDGSATLDAEVDTLLLRAGDGDEGDGLGDESAHVRVGAGDVLEGEGVERVNVAGHLHVDEVGTGRDTGEAVTAIEADGGGVLLL